MEPVLYRPYNIYDNFFKNFCCPPKHTKKLPSKVAQDQQFSVQQVFALYWDSFSHLWSCQTLQDEKYPRIYLNA